MSFGNRGDGVKHFLLLRLFILQSFLQRIQLFLRGHAVALRRFSEEGCLFFRGGHTYRFFQRILCRHAARLPRSCCSFLLTQVGFLSCPALSFHGIQSCFAGNFFRFSLRFQSFQPFFLGFFTDLRGTHLGFQRLLLLCFDLKLTLSCFLCLPALLCRLFLHAF